MSTQIWEHTVLPRIILRLSFRYSVQTFTLELSTVWSFKRSVKGVFGRSTFRLDRQISGRHYYMWLSVFDRLPLRDVLAANAQLLGEFRFNPLCYFLLLASSVSCLCEG